MSGLADVNGAHPDTRQRQIDFDLNRVDYDWIAKNSNVKELKQAYRALELDQHFPDLLRECGEKICQLDPKFIRVVRGEKKLSMDEERELNNDIFDFVEKMNQTDKKLRGLATNQDHDKENQSIFGNSDQNGKFQYENSAELEKIQI